MQISFGSMTVKYDVHIGSAAVAVDVAARGKSGTM